MAEEKSKNAKLIIVDDEERVRKIIAVQLEREGYEVRVCTNGREVFNILGSGKSFDVLITDIRMPDIDGHQVLSYAIENIPDMPVIMLTGVVDIETAVGVMKAGAFDYLIKPIQREDLLKTVDKALAYGKLVQYNRRLELENRKYQSDLEEDVKARTKELSEALLQLRIVHMDTVRILSGAIEEKDPYIRGHSNRVRHLSHHIAEALGFTTQQINLLDFGALLHDIGKIAIDSRILNKPASLSQDERKIVETHPLVGERIISKVSYFNDIVPVIRWHHERWDGGGYPDALKGNEIPLSARILAVVDTFDAMTSDRAYRLALPMERALSIIREETGRQFDPEIIEVFFNEKTYELHSEDT
jgi:putative two-component system response regulator